MGVSSSVDPGWGVFTGKFEAVGALAVDPGQGSGIGNHVPGQVQRHVLVIPETNNQIN